MMESARNSKKAQKEKFLDRANKIHDSVLSAKISDCYEKEKAERNGATSGKGGVDHINEPVWRTMGKPQGCKASIEYTE